jgi:hypothetical protein
MTDQHPQQFDPADEGWHEDIRKEPTRKDGVWRAMKVMTALLVLAGLLYISGIYQSTFFSRTSSDAKPMELEVLVDGETKTVPLTIINIVDKNNRENKKNKEEIGLLVNKASRIWDQAGIDIVLEGYATEEVEREEISDLLNDPRSLLDKRQTQEENAITVFLLHSLRGVNGVAFIGDNTIALAEFTSVYNFRVLAHEVGHILGLGHVTKSERLMDEQARGAKLIEEEAVKAREAATRILEAE